MAHLLEQLFNLFVVVVNAVIPLPMNPVTMISDTLGGIAQCLRTLNYRLLFGLISTEEIVANIALEIHTVLRFDEISVVERHLSPPEQPVGGAEARHSQLELERLCLELLECTKSMSRNTRILASQTIVALAVADPRVRSTLKKTKETSDFLSRITSLTRGSEIKKWVSGAIGNEEVHRLWSDFITEPISLGDAQRLSEVVENDDKYLRAKGAELSTTLFQEGAEVTAETTDDVLQSADSPPASSQTGFIANENGSDHLIELEKSLCNPESSYLARLYLDHAVKLMKNGPLDNVVPTIAHLLRRCNRQGNVLLDERDNGSAGCENSSMITRLLAKLLKYVAHANTAISSMEEIIALSIDIPSLRATLQRCANELLQTAEKNCDGEIRKMAKYTFHAIRSEHIHKLWSTAINHPLGGSDLQHLLDGNDANGDEPSEGLAELAESLRHPESEYLAHAYLKRAIAKKEKILEDVCHEVRLLLKNEKRSTTTFAKACFLLGYLADKAISTYSPTSKAETQLRCYLKDLLDYARGLVSVRISALKALCEMMIEDSRVRMVLKSLDLKETLSRLMEPQQNSEIAHLASAAFAIFENENLHKHWSLLVAKPLTFSDVQQLANGTIADENEVVKKFEKALSSAFSEPKYLANFYIEVAMKSIQEDPLFREKTSLIPTGNYTPTMESLHCDDCRRKHPQYRISSEELLKYVLKTAPEGSLEDLTEVVPMPKDLKARIGKGGFAEVFQAKIRGKEIAIKLLKINHEEVLHCKGRFVVRNFARELRVLARLSHPNVLHTLGYALWEGGQYYIASKWMERGDLHTCMHSLTAPELFEMSLGIAKGVCYLHKVKIVHGDLKSLNVLVSRSGDPVLADFGLARLTESLWSKGFYSTVTARTSVRWVPYEYYHVGDSEIFRPDTKSDVWSFGMTILELLTLDVPYADIKNDGAVSRAILNGEEPVRIRKSKFAGEELASNLWSVCRRCWTRNRGKRPSMRDVLHELTRMNYLRNVANRDVYHSESLSGLKKTL